MDIAALVSFFTELAFPIAFAAYFVVVLSKSLERMRTNQLKQMVLLALMLDKWGVVIPDSELKEVVGILKAKHKRNGLI